MDFRKKPFVVLFCLLSIGILMGHIIRLPTGSFFISYGACLFLGALFIRRYPRTSFLFIAASFVFLGSLRLQAVEHSFRRPLNKTLKSYYYQTVMVQGMIVSDVQQRPFFKKGKSVFALDVWRVRQDGVWRERREKVLATAFGKRALAYGDIIETTGKLYPPFNFSNDTFSYKKYLARKGITTLLSVKTQDPVTVLKSQQGNVIARAAMRIKKRLGTVFAEHLTANESAIAEAMFLGDKYRIPKEINKVFVATGTAHILVISGMNIGIMAFLIFFVLQAFAVKRNARIVVTIFILGFYALLTGAQPPVTRATLMACIFLCGMLCERQEDHINSLALSGVILLLMNPWNLFDAGFQLSFASVFAILCFYPPVYTLVLKKVFRGQSIPRWVDFFLQAFVLSLVVWVSIAGIIAYYFHIVTPITVIANVALVPLIAPMMAFCTGLLVSGSFASFLAPAFATLTKITLNTMVAIVLLLSKVPHGAITLEYFSLGQTIGYSLAACLLFVLVKLLAQRLVGRANDKG